MFTGRVLQPGDPEFLAEDTDLGIALAEEEAATCPRCGQLKVWCRDKDNQFAFQAVEDQCHATYALAAHQVSASKDRDDPTRAAVQTYTRFRDGHEPDPFAGLDLSSDD